ncbi:hypothetical protein BS47DRAFT_1358689 [Hydnum rufescens UP504]|uniref:Uncharacterized protein n=1 Tax=Hydnum rufescens UP504 TaxID=1448309 RepID=A0A9P6B9R6_9AGAM|nr:hypothetical protein BS47DRAFT_1358689 [Hydnum rufescens UP504]
MWRLTRTTVPARARTRAQPPNTRQWVTYNTTHPLRRVCSYIGSPFRLPNEIANESRTPACYATRSETWYRTPALAGVWYSQASSLHENLPDENTMKPRTKYGLPHARSGGLLYMKTCPPPKTQLQPQPSNVRIAVRDDDLTMVPHTRCSGCVVISDHPSWCKNTPSASPGQAQFKLLTCAAAQDPIQMPHPAPNTVQYLTTDKTKYHTPAAADVWNGTWCTSPVLWGEFGLHFQY